MSWLNIKNLWIQQIKTNEENTIEPVEIKVTDVEVELNEEETRIYERMIEKNKKREVNDEENLREELSELEDEPPKINRKRKHENESQEAMKRRMIEKKSEIVKELIQELETPTLREEEITEETEEESSRQDD